MGVTTYGSVRRLYTIYGTNVNGFLILTVCWLWLCSVAVGELCELRGRCMCLTRVFFAIKISLALRDLAARWGRAEALFRSASACVRVL